jgi:hypothetical protein
VGTCGARHDVRWEKEAVLHNRAGGTAQMLEDRRANPLIQTAVDVHGHFGVRSRAGATGSTDANAAVGRGIPALSIGRTTGGDQHTLTEWANVADALPATKIALLISVLMAGLSTTTS